MGKQVVHQKRFGFIAGLNTEASYLTSPENTWREGQNVVPQINGELHRRTAIDVENNYVLSPLVAAAIKQSQAFTVREWNSVAGDGGTNFAVVQFGSLIYFYPNNGGTLSPNRKLFTIDLATYKVANPSIVGTSVIHCASGNGKLVITSQDTSPILVTYTAVTDTIAVTPITVSIRDLTGIDDGLVINNKPATLSNLHEYNLLNQGWTAAQWDAYFAANAVYPSNAQDWTSGKDTSSVFQPALLDKVDFGTSPAAKGRYVLDVFNRDRSTISGVVGITAETELYRPTTVAFFAGRAFYAGTKSAKIGNWVMFSQVAETDTRWGSCYQEADPTSEVLFDLIDTDGGVIPIQDAGTILKLVPIQNTLIVIADNGVWQISSPDSGFSAVGYSVRKLSSIGCVGIDTVVEVENTLFYMSSSGIYTISPDQTGMAYVCAPLTDLVIKSLILNIPVLGKTYCKALFHEEEKRVYWLYNNNINQDGIVDRYKKTHMLVLDTRLKSFYTLAIGELAVNTPIVVDAIVTKGRASTDNAYTVTDNAGANLIIDSVLDNNQVIANGAYLQGLNRTIKYLTIVFSGGSYGVTFADKDKSAVLDNAARFADWKAIDTVGVESPAYILTGYDLMTDNADKMKQPLYVTVYSRATETGFDVNYNVLNPSSILMQAQWDWTNNIEAGKWTTEQEVYRHIRSYIPMATTDVPSHGYPVLVTKNKVRGEGKSISFKWSAGVGKEMKLAGWEITYVGNSNV